ncbi:alpha/beta fold hydrolase [Gilvimarinus sp. F26214L]|uniref:alpha/beta fold hydrolase n=1 Tax=Gilvimarinus sp. DZF01 TaxID=3461371 RepID=UPI00404679AC
MKLFPISTSRLLRFCLLAALVVSSHSFSEEPTLRYIETNGIKMRIAEAGSGPLVILVHGWPESWYSWRHQLSALAEAGYHAVAPDMRGYGKTDKPRAVEDYDIKQVTADVAGIVDALGEESAVLIGHDWGSIVTWNSMLLYPEKYTGLVAMSVPYGGRSPVSPVDGLRRAFGDNFYYILYFQEWNVAEREFDADPRGILSRLYLSPDSPREAPEVTDPKRSAGGWIPRLGAAKELPDWLSEADLDYYVQEFSEAGFRGGINYYRNFHRNWEITEDLAGVKIEAPVAFIAGEQDVVIGGRSAEQLTATMQAVAPDFRGVTLFPDTGHWVQQERPEDTNAAILKFLDSLK